MLGHIMHLYETLRHKNEEGVRAHEALQRAHEADAAAFEQENARRRKDSAALEKAEASITRRVKPEPDAPKQVRTLGNAKKKFRLWGGPRIEPAPYGPFDTEGQ